MPTKPKKEPTGDIVYAACVNYSGKVEVQTATVVKRGPKTLKIAGQNGRYGGQAFGYRTILNHSDACVSAVDALTRLSKGLEAGIQRHRSDLSDMERQLVECRKMIEETES